jgi:deoxyribonuclease-2
VNPSGDEVDWYSIFMIPKSSSGTDTIAFGYMDSTSTTMKYTQYKKGNFPPISMTSSIKLKSVKNVNYFFWNDDTGGSVSSTKAHSKGALVYDKDGGYFLSHSLPRFPAIIKEEISDDFPDNAGIFAQSWLCVSISKTEAIKIANELTITNPQVYINVDEDMVDSPPNEIITKLIKNRGDPKLPKEHQVSIESKGKIKFDIFSKSKEKNDLQWDYIVPSFYSDSFYSETWTKPERLPNVCDQKYQVLNVLTLKFGKFEFAYDNEHSKWSVAKKKNVICFGDLNRTESQKSRGGMVTCFENTKLAGAVRDTITDYEKCTKEALIFLSDETS